MQSGLHLPTYRDDYGASPLHVAIEESAQVAEALVRRTPRHDMLALPRIW